MNFSKINPILFKISRICAIFLFFLLLAYFFSGVFLRSGRFDYVLLRKIHALWLPLPSFILFLLHSLIEIKFLLLRLKFKDSFFLNFLLLGLGAFLFSLFLYFLW